MSTPAKDNRTSPGLGPAQRAHIGRKLREFFDGLAAEPVPERFKILLDRLEAAARPESLKTRNPDEPV